MMRTKTGETTVRVSTITLLSKALRPLPLGKEQVVDGQVSGRIRFSDGKPAGLRQNQRLTTRILMDEHPDVLMVERGPFVDTGGGRVAYVVHGNVADRTAIEVGATSLNAVEIVNGVKEGDRIVISGTDAFKGAQRVALE